MINSVFDSLFRGDGQLYFEKGHGSIAIRDVQNTETTLVKQEVVGNGVYKTATLYLMPDGTGVVLCKIQKAKRKEYGDELAQEGTISKQLIDEGIPNILTVKIAIGIKTPMTISPWCDRGTLERIIGAAPDITSRVQIGIPIIIAMADTLKNMHAHAWCHLDFKPNNVFVTGTPAICSSLGDLTSVTRTGKYVLAGTLLYAAPERIKANMYARAKPAEDVFAFGVSLFEVIHGLDSPLFGALGEDESEQQLPGRVEKRQRKLRTRGQRDGVQLFYEIVADCISFDPEKRPSMAEVHERVQAAWSNYIGLISTFTRHLRALRIWERARKIWNS